MNWLKKIWAYPKGKWALTILGFFFCMALFADFIANEKPIYCKYQGETFFPIFHNYGAQLGMLKPYAHLKRTSWQDLELDHSIYPPIKFKPESISSFSKKFSSPGTLVKAEYFSKRHWLGTDGIGRDVAAGLVYGSRITILIGFLAMLISCCIGFLFGVLSGFYGDDSLKINPWLALTLVLGMLFIFFQWVFGHLSFLVTVILAILFVALIILINQNLNSKKVNIPMDIIVMRMIEIFKSIPALFILLAVLALIAKPSLLSLVVIIGLLRWTTIARVLRAELFKLKAKDFVTSARALGMSNYQILRRHILPNALPSLLTIIAFGFAGVILIEATLSFLGIGLSAEQVTWGSLLSEARRNFSAWWLALFPGITIFLMVIACNYLGDTLNEINLSSD